MPGGRRARIEDVHELALAMPHVTVYPGTAEKPVYQVGGKSFVFFRNPRPDAVDPRMMMRLARMTALGGRGLAKQIDPREDPDYFNRVRAFAALQLTDEELKDWMT